MSSTCPLSARIINPSGKMPVGLSDFAELGQGDYCFVDKTLFIKEVLDTGDKVSLIIRPRRFGKTINMSMLKEFLREPQKKGEDVFQNLAINQAGECYQQERGKRPVIYVSFRTVKELNWDDAWIRMRGLLSGLAQESSEKISLEGLTYDEQDILNKVIHKQANPTECESILAILTKLLTLKHKGMTPWVLIDEYDAPMQSAYQNDYYKPMRNLMKGLLGDCLKDNDFLHRGIVTGILRVSKEDIFSDLNNLGVYGVLQDRFASCFGFVEDEVKGLLSARGLEDRLDTVRAWYDGYCIGADEPVTIYNPWSVINHLANPTKIPQPYWVNTSSNHLVRELLSRADASVKQGLRQLLTPACNHTTTQTVCEYIPLYNVEKDSRNLWGLLLAAGYLTSAARQNIPGSNNPSITLRIPNQEVLGVYGDLVNRWLRGGEAGGGGGMELLEALVAGEVDVFAERFERLVLDSMSYFDPGGYEPERFYHGFVLGMMQHLRDRYIVDSQGEAGLARYDLALEPKDSSLPGFVMEFKSCVRKSDSPTDTAQHALQQIQEKQYHRHLIKRGAKTIIALGLAFKGKEVCVKHRKICHDGAENS